MGTSSDYVAPTGGGWPAAKRQATTFARQGGAQGTQTTAAAVGAAYVAAHGGAGAAARSYPAAQRVAQALGGFLAGVARRGLDATLVDRGLGDLVGQGPGVVLAGIIDALAGPNRTLDEADARAALIAVLAQELPAPAAAALDAGAIADLIAALLVECVFQRLLQELGAQLAGGALTATDAVRVERDLHAYVVAQAQLDLGGVDALAVDWEGAEGPDLVGHLLTSAYAQLEAEVGR